MLHRSREKIPGHCPVHVTVRVRRGLPSLRRRRFVRGMKSLSARIGRCVNRVYERSGAVLDGRYHHRVLRTPREVRHAVAYVLLNARRHFYQRHHQPPPQVRLDPASSAAWFDGWKAMIAPLKRSPPPMRSAAKEVADARTWLLTRGWRKYRLIDPSEVPGFDRRSV